MDVSPTSGVQHKLPHRQEILLEQQEIQQLAERDREVRAHEQAHASVGGRYAGSPNYSYARGPNGVSYAVGGHVDVDVAEVPGDPAATLAKMQVVQRAAMAPQNPSPQDRAVAAKAMQQAAQARAELAASESAGVREGTKGAFVDLLA